MAAHDKALVVLREEAWQSQGEIRRLKRTIKSRQRHWYEVRRYRDDTNDPTHAGLVRDLRSERIHHAEIEHSIDILKSLRESELQMEFDRETTEALGY